MTDFGLSVASITNVCVPYSRPSTLRTGTLYNMSVVSSGIWRKDSWAFPSTKKLRLVVVVVLGTETLFASTLKTYTATPSNRNVMVAGEFPGI